MLAFSSCFSSTTAAGCLLCSAQYNNPSACITAQFCRVHNPDACCHSTPVCAAQLLCLISASMQCFVHIGSVRGDSKCLQCGMHLTEFWQNSFMSAGFCLSRGCNLKRSAACCCTAHVAVVWSDLATAAAATCISVVCVPVVLIRWFAWCCWQRS